VPFSSRGLTSSIVSIGGRIGGTLAPVLTAYLIIAFVPADAPLTLRPGDILDEPGMVQSLDTYPAGWQGELRERVFLAIHDEHPGPFDARALREQLNRLLASPELFAGLDLDNVPLEREGRRLANQVSPLDAVEQLRLNRFLLEAAFPEEIRKYYGAGWRPVMIIYGLAGLAVALLYWLGARDTPRQHPWSNEAEARLVEGSLPDAVARPTAKLGELPLVALLTSTSMWLNSAVQFLTNFGWLFLITWMPRYLAEVHKVPVDQRSWMASFPIFAGMFGTLAGGWITDRAAQRLGLRLGRMLPIAITRFMAAGGFFACLLLQSPWPVTVALAVVAVSVDLGIGAMWGYGQDVAGPNAGAVLGWGNMWGNFGATVSPIVLNFIEKHYHWDGVFIACGAAFLLSGFLSFGIDATKRIEAQPTQ
jgi:nitrate/nitrite transporter NarK